jgi:putative membrane protein
VAQRRFMRRPNRSVGHDPDYRFSLANERTFLAWIRTALALVAGGLAATQFLPELGIPFAREIIGVALVGLGTMLAIASFHRWATNEEAMRLERPIPTSRLPGLLAIGVALVSVTAVLLLISDEVLVP